VPNPLYTGPPPPGGWPVPGELPETAGVLEDRVVVTDGQVRPIGHISRMQAEAAEPGTCAWWVEGKVHGPHLWTDGRPPYLACHGRVGQTL
jgi:hypothetical protein